MRYIKEKLWALKIFLYSIFLYPVSQIEITNSVDYDAYWKEKRGKHIGDLSEWQKDRADFILDILLKQKNNETLTVGDIGCGDGSILKYLRQKNTNIIKGIGYDNSLFALDKAREFGLETHFLDIAKLESESNLAEVDFYLLLEVLEHIPNSEALLKQVLLKSRKGVFFSFPNSGYIQHRIRFMLGKFPLQWKILPNEHVRFWTYADLKWWLHALKIENYEIHCYRGILILNQILPSLFASGFIVYINKKSD